MIDFYCVNLSQGGTNLQEVRGPSDPRPELHWPSSVLFPLVTALVGGERLLPDVHEPRQRQDQLCAAVRPGVQSESGPCLHRHQIWSLHRELHSVGQLCVCPRADSSRVMIYARGYFVFVMHAWSVCFCSGV